MVIKIYGLALSTCTKRVLMTLKEKNAPYELVQIDFVNGEHKTPAYLEKQPFGMMPYLDDDGFIVYESRAMCRYIEAKYKDQGTSLIPTDLKDLGLFEQGASIEQSYWDPYVSKIIFEKVFKPWKGMGEPDTAYISELASQLTEYLGIYENILSKQEYIGGNKFTLADLFHIPYGALLFLPQVNLGRIITRYPHVEAWWEKITARDSWKAVN